MTTNGASITVTRKRGFTVVYNDLLPADGTLSARAWGIYVYLVGRPDGWECRVNHLAKVFAEGRDAIYKALKDLETAGLMTKIDYIEDGLRRTRYALNADVGPEETPRSSPDTDSQDPGNQEPGNPHPEDPDPDSQEPEKPGQVSKESTKTEGPKTEEASTEPATQTAPGKPDAQPSKPLEVQIAEAWWEHYTATYGPIVRGKGTFVVLRDQLIKRALDAGFTENEVKRALKGPEGQTPNPVPSIGVFQQRLSEVRNGTLARSGTRTPDNVHHVPENDPDRAARIAAWGGPKASAQ